MGLMTTLAGFKPFISGIVGGTVLMALASLLVGRCSDKNDIEKMQANLAAQVRNYDACTANAVKLQKEVVSAKESIDNLADASRVATEASNKNLQAVQGAANKLRGTALEILSRQPVGDQCEAAFRLLKE